jgi:hypothetical protein
MTTIDIFLLVSNILSKNTKDDVNSLYILSQTCKEMNSIVNINTDYNVLKKLAHFHNLSEAVVKTVGKAIDNCTNGGKIEVENAARIACEDTSYIIPYLYNEDLLDINVEICTLYLDWNDTSVPRNYRDRCLIEAKILYDFIKNADNHYEFHLMLPYTLENNEGFKQYEEDFIDWLRAL